MIAVNNSDSRNRCNQACNRTIRRLREPLAIDMGELPYERHQRHIRQARMVRQQVVASLQQLIKLAQKHLAFGPIKLHRLLGITLGVLVAIQMHFER